MCGGVKKSRIGKRLQGYGEIVCNWGSTVNEKRWKKWKNIIEFLNFRKMIF